MEEDSKFMRITVLRRTCWSVMKVLNQIQQVRLFPKEETLKRLFDG
jgi:hypothetical protein